MGFSRGWRVLILFALLVSFGSTVSLAQENGSIEGRVLKDGKGVGGVAVLVSELKKVEITDSKGAFKFKNIPAGGYTLILTQGSNNFSRPEVFLTGGQKRELDIEVDWDLGVQETVTVTAAAARAAKIVDAPAAVTSITEEQIEREASHGQLPKVLEFTPGAEVTQSGLYDFNFNTRGFNSSLNRRVSTYIDGRDVGVVLLGAQEWAAISGGLGDVANLEFIRGPSAALYGANASSGVINITTKAPRDSQGEMLRMASGELNTFGMDYRKAAALGKGFFYKVTAGFRNSGDFSISRNGAAPEYSKFCLIIGETNCLPRERELFREQDNDIRFGSVRVDKYLKDDSSFTLEYGLSDIEGPVFQTGIGRVQIRDARRPFYRFAYSSEHWTALAHYSSRLGDQANLSEALVANFELLSDTERYGFETQGNWNFFGDKLRFVIGAAHTEETVDTADPKTGRQTVVYQPINTDRQAIFSQLDWKAHEKIKVVVAARVDANTLHDTQFSPKVAMVYSIDPKNSLRFTYNEAFQVANYSEFFLHTAIASFAIQSTVDGICMNPNLTGPVTCEPIPNIITVPNNPGGFIPILAVGNNDLELEETKAIELGYSGLLANRAFITFDYYRSKNKNFITDLIQQVGTSLGQCLPGDPVGDPKGCSVNNDYGPWVGPADWETEMLLIPFSPPITAADSIRTSVERSVGGSSLGFELAEDLNGDTVIVGRTYTNVGEVETQGFDLGLQYFINEAWSVRASYSWFDFEIVDDDVIAPEEFAEILLPNTPEHKASMSLSFARKQWSASLSGRWVDDFFWSAGVFRGPVEAYTTFDLSANYQATETIGFGLNIANLRDTAHYQSFGGDLLTRRALANLTVSW